MKKYTITFIILLFIGGISIFHSAGSLSFADETNDPLSTQETEKTIEKKEFEYKNGTFYITKEGNTRQIPAWMTIIPPLVAILIALIFREVLSSLFLGILSGVLILKGFSFTNIFLAFFTVIDTYVIGALNDGSHLSVIVFSMLIGSLVAIISLNGGMKGVINKLSVYASSPRRGQFITWMLGLLIFFDDYANTLVVGNTMRSVTDKLKISREKLAYLVDATAAPVASVAFITTWIGAELGFIQQAIDVLNADKTTIQLTESAYSVFLNSLQFSFYPILTIVFIFMLIYSRKDFGPMLKAEKRARSTGRLTRGEANTNTDSVDESLKALEPVRDDKHRWYNAMIPVLVLIISVLIGLLYTGFDGDTWNDKSLAFTLKLSKTIGASDSYKALLWSSAFGVLVAMGLTIFQRIMTFTKTIDAFTTGIKTMLPAVLVLILAWALGQITVDLHTADFLANVLSDKIDPYWLAELTFLIAAIISFSTGTSWGTMTILYPIALPLAWSVCHQAGLPEEEILRIFYNVVSVVLAGAVFGDHCSPISDTTILSSMASSCPHIDHVRTQLPYAVIVAVISTFVCTKLSDFGMGWYIVYPVGFAILFLVIRILGKKSEPAPA